MCSAVTIVALLAATLLAVAPPAADAQIIFHSPQSANLPTAETLQKGQWLFEISHRFFPPVSDGADALWGFDGPVINRLGLAYAASDRVMFGVLRSNLSDNLEIVSLSGYEWHDRETRENTDANPKAFLANDYTDDSWQLDHRT